MLHPDQVSKHAKKNEKINFRFRTWLKMNVDSEELDEKFFRLHQELFSEYDCSQCRNCCKQYYGEIPADEVEEDAAWLGLSKEEFKSKYLQDNIGGHEQVYQTKNMPCDFLQKDGSCLLGDHRPENCKKYPYTDQPDRLFSLLSFLDTVSVCPVAYEIIERLKKEYGFSYRTRIY